MKLTEWLEEFAKAHERASRGALSAIERRNYLEARDELARALLKAQRIALQPGQQPRQNLRAAMALPVVLQLRSGRMPCVTQDISAGGFSVMLAQLPASEPVVAFSLRLSREAPPIEGRARVVTTSSAVGSGRLGFAFEDLPPESVERLELAVFDSVVAQLRS